MTLKVHNQDCLEIFFCSSLVSLSFASSHSLFTDKNRCCFFSSYKIILFYAFCPLIIWQNNFRIEYQIRSFLLLLLLPRCSHCHREHSWYGENPFSWSRSFVCRFLNREWINLNDDQVPSAIADEAMISMTGSAILKRYGREWSNSSSTSCALKLCTHHAFLGSFVKNPKF